MRTLLILLLGCSALCTKAQDPKQVKSATYQFNGTFMFYTMRVHYTPQGRISDMQVNNPDSTIRFYARYDTAGHSVYGLELGFTTTGVADTNFYFSKTRDRWERVTQLHGIDIHYSWDTAARKFSNRVRTDLQVRFSYSGADPSHPEKKEEYKILNKDTSRVSDAFTYDKKKNIVCDKRTETRNGTASYRSDTYYLLDSLGNYRGYTSFSLDMVNDQVSNYIYHRPLYCFDCDEPTPYIYYFKTDLDHYFEIPYQVPPPYEYTVEYEYY